MSNERMKSVLLALAMLVPLCASVIAFARGSPSPIPWVSLEKRLR